VNGRRGLAMTRITKRLIDAAVALVLLLLLGPLLLVLAAIICVTMGRPVLFCQRRPGLCGNPFVLYKLRTMRPARDHDGRPLPDHERVTPVGRFLRKTSLDELPQLWNVLRGDMSLVGPRPLLTQYLARYTPAQSRRHEVRPGITGWAQIHGRQTVAFSRRLELDVWYVDHWSLWLDFKIICKTIVTVLRAEGVKLDQRVEEVDDLGLYVHPE
jgi:sugar transferase EpsL